MLEEDKHNIKKVDELKKKIEEKLHITKLAIYGTSIISSVCVILSTKMFESATINWVNNNMTNEFKLPAALATVGALGISTSIVEGVPRIMKLSKEKKELQREKEELIENNRYNNSITKKDIISDKEEKLSLNERDKMIEDYFKSHGKSI